MKYKIIYLIFWIVSFLLIGVDIYLYEEYKQDQQLLNHSEITQETLKNK